MFSTIERDCDIASFFLPIIALGSGCAVYLALSIFFMPFKIVLPLSIIISIIVGGLTKYYTEGNNINNNNDKNNINHWIAKSRKEGEGEGEGQERDSSTQNTRALISHIIFSIAYIALLVISVIFFGLMNYPFHNELYEPWQQFTVFDTMKLVSAIGLSFFLPGYALINIIFSDRKKKQLKTFPKILLGYIFSMAITGFAGFITALLGFAVSDIKIAIIIIHMTVLVFFLQQLEIIPSTRILLKGWKNRHSFNPLKVWHNFPLDMPRLIVFGSFFALVGLFTYVVYNGVIVGDQWFHHGRALQFISGDYKAIAFSNIDFPYPPLLSAVLSSFFVLADVPTVNSYASIGFLNLISVFAFYYFFQNWTPIHRRRSALLAAALFVLGSGFGWIHAINTFVADPGPDSQESALLSILTTSKQTYDIRAPSTFLLASHPDITTGLQLIVLPVGFVLLGMIKDEEINPKKKDSYFIVIVCVIVVIVVFGIFSHDEIYFFIIIVCLLPIIFGLRDKGFIYIGILAANGFAILANYSFLPYLSGTVIMGLPLMVLSFLFVIIMWVFYLSRILERSYRYIAINKAALFQFLPSPSGRTKFALSVALVSGIIFLYALSYITWAGLSVKDIEVQISELFPRNVPWYLLPMKVGLIGILGLYFILSCIFRRVEKEVFVFGIIAIIAIVTGPYYDEQRFNKYVMIGLIGFASLLVYDLLVFINQKYRYRDLLSGSLIGVVIVLGCLSTLMFVGFQAASIETKNFDFLWEGRRNFPSSSELHMLQFFQNNNAGSHLNSPGMYNIVTWPKEYQLKLGLIGKFEAFLGVPIPKMLQSPLALNSSTLESFYNLLARSGAHFVVVPSTLMTDKSDVKAQQGKKGEEVTNEQEMKQTGKSNDIFDFALANFQKIYQDNNFTILSVPGSLAPPSSTGDTAIIHPWTEDESTISDIKSAKITLPYRGEFFSKIDDSEFVKVSEDKESVLLYTDNKSQTLWSKDIEYKQGKFDYIEAKFRITDQNRDKQYSECGVIWESEGEKKYYVRIRDDKLEFSETPAPKDRFNIESRQVKLKEGISYSLKLAFSESALSVYVDDIHRLHVPSDLYQGNDRNAISRIGIRCSGSTAVFEQLNIAQMNQLPNNDFNSLHEKQQIDQYYYPLTALALSGIKYDTFLPNDGSVFSKNNIILTTKVIDDYYSDSDNISMLLDYVKDGGKLIIISTDGSMAGWFTKSFAVNKINSSSTEFNNVVESTEPKNSVELAATTMDIESISSDVVVKSYYQNNSEKISPLALEKSHGIGKIILVNAAGYFDAISRSPEKYFLRLADFPRLAGIYSENSNERTTPNPLDSTYYLGNLRISGTTTINGSSLLLPSDEENYNGIKYNVKDVSFVTTNTEDGDKIAFTANANNNNNDNNNNYDISINPDFENNKTSIFRDILIDKIEVYGQYNVTIKSFGTLDIPSPSAPLTQSNYVSLSVPAGLDMILTVNNESYAKITMANSTEKTIKIASYSSSNNNNTDSSLDLVHIYFHNIRPNGLQANYVPILMKRPEIMAYGNATFESLFKGKYDFDVYKGIEGNSFETREDSINLKLNYVDNYHSSSKNRQMTDYLTYVELSNVNELSESTTEGQGKLRIPGDISDKAKQEGILVPWDKAIISNASITLALVLSAASLLCIFLLWPYQYKRTRVGKQA